MRELNLDKSHLHTVGSIYESNSDNYYGKYYKRCVANIQWYNNGFSIDECLKWMEKYHPIRMYTNLLMITSGNPNVEDCYTSIYFTLDRDNKNWYKENYNSEFAVYLRSNKRRNKQLPGGLSDNIYLDWCQESKPMFLDGLYYDLGELQ